jgi:hypothetical protein
MESNLIIWIAKSLLKNCAEVILRRIGVDDEGLSHPRVAKDRFGGEGLFEGSECGFLFLRPSDRGSFDWGTL